MTMQLETAEMGPKTKSMKRGREKGDKFIENAIDNIEEEFEEHGTAREAFITHAFPIENLGGIVEQGSLLTGRQLSRLKQEYKYGSDAPLNYTICVSQGGIHTGYILRRKDVTRGRIRSAASYHEPGGTAVIFPIEEMNRLVPGHRRLPTRQKDILREKYKRETLMIDKKFYTAADEAKRGSMEYREQAAKYSIGSERTIDIIPDINYEVARMARKLTEEQKHKIHEKYSSSIEDVVVQYYIII